VARAANAGNMNMCRHLLDTGHEDLLKKQKRGPYDYGDLNFPAHACAIAGDREMLAFVLKHEPEILIGNAQKVTDNKLFFKGDRIRTSLAGAAAAKGDVAQLDYLYQLNPESIKARNSQYETPAHEAAANGNLAGIKYLFQKNKNAFRDIEHYGYTPAVKAFYGNYAGSTDEERYSVIEYIAKNDPDALLILDDQGERLLDIAAQSGRSQIVDLVAAYKPEALIMSSKNHGTPALRAANANEMETLERILSQVKSHYKTLNPKNDDNFFNKLYATKDRADVYSDTVVGRVRDWSNSMVRVHFNGTDAERKEAKAKRGALCLRIQALLVDLKVRAVDNLCSS
jgi:ankyrin repeat protein